jgi:hypothetical protein
LLGKRQPSRREGGNEQNLFRNRYRVLITAGAGRRTHARIPLLDLSVGEGFQLFDDLLQPATTLGMVLLRR